MDISIAGKPPSQEELTQAITEGLARLREANRELAEREPWLFGEGDPPWIIRVHLPCAGGRKEPQ